MRTLEQAIQARDNAFRSGDMEAAAKLHAFVRHEQSVRSKDERFANGISPEGASPDVPGFVSDELVTLNLPEAPDDSLLGKVKDVAVAPLEVGATLATAPVGAAVGLGSMFTEAAKAYFDGEREGKGVERLGEFFRSTTPEEVFGAGVQKATFQPRSDTAQAALSALSKATESLPPVLGTGLAGVASQSARASSPILRSRVVDPALESAKRGASKTSEAARSLSDRVKTRIDEGSPNDSLPLSPEQLALAKDRQKAAADLDVPIKLTKGQATQDFDQLQFERTIAKDAKLGESLRERAREHNAQVSQNFDAWVDQIGSERVDLGDKGVFIDKAFQDIMSAKKSQINALYDKARVNGELQDSVSLDGVIEYLNNPITRAAKEDSRVLKTVERALINTNAARRVDSVDENGNRVQLLESSPVNLNVGEEIRKAVGNNTSNDASDIRIASIIKKAYDADTHNSGGQLYQKARKARSELARDFEDNDLVRRLTAKRLDTGEKLIAIEEMAEKSVLSAVATVDRIRKMKNILFKTQEGRQAWKEIQGAALDNIRNQVFGNADFDSLSQNPVPSFSKFDKAINKLDKSGKLEVIFTKKGAAKLRSLRDATRSIVTAPKGTVNTSDTATILAAMFDAAGSAATGVPAPIATGLKAVVGRIKDAKIKNRVNDALKGV